MKELLCPTNPCPGNDGDPAEYPRILCTGYSERINEQSATQMGIRAFVMKPIIMKEMADTIRKVLDRKSSDQN